MIRNRREGDPIGITFNIGPGLGYDQEANELYVSMVQNLDDPDLNRPVSGVLVSDTLVAIENLLKTV